MHLYFDFFGTLCDTSSTSLDAARAILKRNGYADLDAEAFKTAWDTVNDYLCRGPFLLERDLFQQGFLGACQLFGISPPSDSVDELIAATERRVLYPDAASSLERLGRRFTLHVASNTDNHAIDAIIGPIRSRFASISTSEDLRVYKPTPAFYEKMMQAGGSQPNDSLYVGDSLLNDVIGPQRLGIEAHLIDRDDAYPELARTHATLTAFADRMLARA